MNIIKPIHDRVLILRDREEEKTPGGIIIPDVAKKEMAQGEVLAVGPGKVLPTGDTREPVVKPGDRVIFGKYAGTEVTLDRDDKRKSVIVCEDDILAVIELGF